MRGITLSDLETVGAQILLSNTYHLHLQPGEDLIENAGGLHSFINWDKPILTDSGGYQVFSLRKGNKIEDHGVHFQSHINGDKHFLGPEEAITMQHKLGSDIIMVFDECPPSTAPREQVEKAVDRTLRWAKECKEVHAKKLRSQEAKKLDPLLFAIIQGGLHPDLRKKCAEELIAMDFDGYAIGGLAVGESPEEMYDVVDAVCPLLPEDKPRYLMGVGVPEQLRICVGKGIDMFDCVWPMRLARHGKIQLSNDTVINIENVQYRDDFSLVDPTSPSPLSTKHTKSYLHYLFKARERYYDSIACLQNLGVTLGTMQELRESMNNEK